MSVVAVPGRRRRSHSRQLSHQGNGAPGACARQLRSVRRATPPRRCWRRWKRTSQRKATIPLIGDPDEITVAYIKAFYNAIAVLIEKECGLMAVSLVHLSHEGFGRALVTVGKLVVLDRTLREVHRFGFESLSKMKNEADKYLSVALEIIGKYPEVAGL